MSLNLHIQLNWLPHNTGLWRIYCFLVMQSSSPNTNWHAFCIWSLWNLLDIETATLFQQNKTCSWETLWMPRWKWCSLLICNPPFSVPIFVPGHKTIRIEVPFLPNLIYTQIFFFFSGKKIPQSHKEINTSKVLIFCFLTKLGILDLVIQQMKEIQYYHDVFKMKKALGCLWLWDAYGKWLWIMRLVQILLESPQNIHPAFKKISCTSYNFRIIFVTFHRKTYTNTSIERLKALAKCWQSVGEPLDTR